MPPLFRSGRRLAFACGVAENCGTAGRERMAVGAGYGGSHLDTSPHGLSTARLSGGSTLCSENFARAEHRSEQPPKRRAGVDSDGSLVR